jgi:hypothetical protein
LGGRHVQAFPAVWLPGWCDIAGQMTIKRVAAQACGLDVNVWLSRFLAIELASRPAR